ncbi:thermonuclease family protein [Anaerolinea thermophila]|uniref:thermonuclease family protein n=2 Tax=Anaerolinea TaxID=233189 RepID=UPI0026EA47E3|nr:hypothetical protein [Anaerolinea thermophila]
MKSSHLTVAQIAILMALGLLALIGLGSALYLLLTAPPEDTPPLALSLPTLPPDATPTSAPQPAGSLPAPTPTPPVSACLPSGDAGLSARVVQVLDGITLEVEVEGRIRRVRYLGVELPRQSALAETLNRQWTENQTVRLIADPAVPPGDEIALYYVLAGDRFINPALIREGAALPALYPPGIACIEVFLQEEARARAEGKGVWQDLLAHLPTPAVAVGLTPSACDCNRRYSCADFTTRREAQACFDTCGDYRNTTLDPDHNGLACEELP